MEKLILETEPFFLKRSSRLDKQELKIEYSLKEMEWSVFWDVIKHLTNSYQISVYQVKADAPT